MRRQSLSGCFSVALAVVLGATTAVNATDFAVPSGNFAAGSSWTGGVAPGVNDYAVIDNGGTATILANDVINISGLQAGEAASTTGMLVMNGGTVNVNPTDSNPGDNAVAIGEFGVGTFMMNGGTINLGSLTGPDFDFHVGKSSMGSTMTMTGGTINLGSAFRVARGQDANASATVSLLGGEINVGSGIVVARSDNSDTNTADGTFIVGGTGKFISGNDLGEGNPNGVTDEGYFSIGNRIKASGHVTVKDTGIVKSLRLTGRQGHGDLTIQDNGQFMVVNTLGATGNAPGLYNSYLGGGSSSNGDGGDGNSGVYSLSLKGHGLLDINANASGRDETRPELQGFILGRGNSTATATIQDSATLNVHQRFIIGGLGATAVLNGFDGQAAPGTDPGGTATVTMTGGTVSADQLIVGGSGTGTLNVSGGVVKTQAYNDTFDPTANAGSGSATASVNSIRIGMLQGSTGMMNLSGNANVSTGGDLSIGQYGTGTLKVTGGSASILAQNVFVQKFAGSSGTLIAEITGASQTPVRANESVKINGGTFQILPTAVPNTGAYLWDILDANVDGKGTGTLSGTFTTVTLPGPDAEGRHYTAIYEPTKFLVGLALPGDANFDGKVDFTDLVTLARNYGLKNANWLQGNFDGDGTVDFGDLVALARNYGRVPTAAQLATLDPSFQAAVEQAFAQVPEPTALGTLALAGLMLRRRHR